MSNAKSEESQVVEVYEALLVLDEDTSTAHKTKRKAQYGIILFFTFCSKPRNGSKFVPITKETRYSLNCPSIFQKGYTRRVTDAEVIEPVVSNVRGLRDSLTEEPIGSNSYDSIVYDEATVWDSSWSQKRLDHLVDEQHVKTEGATGARAKGELDKLSF
ncbi:hypothetical protein BDC45DRAFT_561213 [Circinella umbellata]|nr:hypothetical protein BDC45DRAFT_561213 [Circinella umbellata]